MTAELARQYESGKIAERLVEDIFPLKFVQSAEARKPAAVLLACASTSEFPKSDKGPENASVLRAPAPLPTSIPVGVVDPVPPCPTPIVPVK